MSKVRINDLARELEVKSKAILDTLPIVGVTEKKTHSSSLEEHEAEKVRLYIRSTGDGPSSGGKSNSRSSRGEEEIKTKIDLSNISRPGDVLKAITQRKETAVAPAPPRPTPPPAAPIAAPTAVVEKTVAAPPAAVSRPTTAAPAAVKPAEPPVPVVVSTPTPVAPRPVIAPPTPASTPPSAIRRLRRHRRALL
jgi:translation initiation factor IF-2